MQIIRYLELPIFYFLPKQILDYIEKILFNFKLKLPINKNGIIKTIFFIKLVNTFFKVNNNIGLMTNIYMRYLNKNKQNYFTIMFLVLTLNKRYGKNLKTIYFKLIYILFISNLLYNWSFKKKNINKSFLNFLYNCCGLKKKTIEEFRGEMESVGWLSFKTSCPQGNLYDLIIHSFPKSILNISKIIFYNEAIGYIIKKITNKKYEIHLVKKFKNILFLAAVFQIPIFLVSVYNFIFKKKDGNIKKPSIFLIYLWTLCPGFLIFIIHNRKFIQTISLFLIISTISEKINRIRFNIPEIISSYIFASCPEYLLDNYKQKVDNIVHWICRITND